MSELAFNAADYDELLNDIEDSISKHKPRRPDIKLYVSSEEAKEWLLEAGVPESRIVVVSERFPVGDDVGVRVQLKAEWETKTVWLNGGELNPSRSQQVINHSPDGFNWGYGGSGAAQLALAICLELFSEEVARSIYQDVKNKHIATLPQQNVADEFVITVET